MDINYICMKFLYLLIYKFLITNSLYIITNLIYIDIKMKFNILAVLILFSLFSACKNSSSSAASGSLDELYTPYDGQDRPLFFMDTIKDNKGLEYDLAMRGGMLDAAIQVKLRKDGRLIYNQDHKAAGRITNRYTTDFNGDGNSDLVVYTNTEDQTRIGNAYIVGIDGNTVFFKEIQPYMNKENAKGYFGRDSFYIEGNNVIRTFPVYELNQYNQKRPTNMRRYLTYAYSKQDTLQPVNAETK